MVGAVRADGLNGVKDVYTGAGGENIVADPAYTLHDALNLSVGFAFAVDHLGAATAQRPVVIDLGITQVLIRELSESVQGRIQIELSALNLAEQIF